MIKAFPTFTKRTIKDRQSTTDNVFTITPVEGGKSQLELDTSGLTEQGTEINAELLQRYEDAIDGIIKAFTKTINESSDDDHFPSAKAVYNFVVSALPIIVANPTEQATTALTKINIEGVIYSLPTKTSDLDNDSGFIDNTVDNLINYYLKSETYNKTEINSLIDAIKQLEIVVVETLPTPSEETYKERKIYLYQPSGASVYEEYVIAKNGDSYILEKIGDTDIKLTDYYNKTEIGNLLQGKQSIVNVIVANNTNLTHLGQTYVIPLLTKENVMTLFNALASGTTAIITDATESTHYTVKQVDTDGEHFFIIINYYGKFDIEYELDVNDQVLISVPVVELPTKRWVITYEDETTETIDMYFKENTNAKK